MNFLFIRKIIKIGDQWLYITCLKSISSSSNLGWSNYQVLIKPNFIGNFATYIRGTGMQSYFLDTGTGT